MIHNHNLSKNVKFHDKVSNYYVKDIESKETYNLLEEFLKELIDEENKSHT